jgi:hypothetical protein
MLILAGLMGMIGVGAASLVAVQPPAEDDDYADAPEDQAFPEEMMAQPDEALGLAESEPLDPMVGTMHAGLLDDGDIGQDGVADALGEDASDPIAPLALNESAFDGLEFSNFMTGDWISQAHGPEVIDYEAEKESILVVWDDTSLEAQEPSLSVSPDPDDPEVMQVNMNGKPLADVYGDPELSVADLVLMPLSSALMVGLSPA